VQDHLSVFIKGCRKELSTYISIAAADARVHDRCYLLRMRNSEQASGKLDWRSSGIAGWPIDNYSLRQVDLTSRPVLPREYDSQSFADDEK